MDERRARVAATLYALAAHHELLALLLFGGFGASRRGAFAGGELLVRAVTRGPAGERRPGNFPEYQLMP